MSRLLKLIQKDPQIGALMPKRAVRDAACQSGLSYENVIDVFFDGYADRPALGERAYDIKYSDLNKKNIRNHQKAYTFTTYLELQTQIKALAIAWRVHPHCEVQRDNFVCIMGFASVDYAIIDIACAYAKVVTVPLSRSSSSRDQIETIDNIQPVVIASGPADLAVCVEHALRQKSIKSIIVFDYDARVDEESAIVAKAKDRLNEIGSDTSLILLNDLIKYGKKHSFSFLTPEKDDNDKTAMIIHSSGSTGKPKGACITAKALINTWQGQPDQSPIITVIMAPFNHNMGRNEMYNTLNAGGTAYFALKDDMSTLFEDIRLARPTSLVFFPRILDLIYQYFQIEVTKRLMTDEIERTVVEHEVKLEMKSTFLGNRLLFGAVASAPVSTAVKEFISECFEIVLVNGYSTTETGSGGLAIDGHINRKIVCDYRLKDVPELGYFTTDKPYPRGEFCVKTLFGVTQYYKQPEATAQLFDVDGYSLTGDIVEEIAPDEISIIDRRMSILKLPQGEYVALGMLGKTFEGNSALINQIYIYGRSDIPYLLAVIVPNLKTTKEMISGTPTETKLKIIIKNELNRIAKHENLKHFEVPRDFIIETEQFSQSNGLLSPINKYLLSELKTKYQPRLEQIFKQISNQQKPIINTLNRATFSSNTSKILANLLKENLGIVVSDNDTNKSFYELGGDSLSAVLFSMHIKQIFGVSIEGDLILNPRNNIKNWTILVDQAQGDNTSTNNFDHIHDEQSQYIYSTDLQIDHFLNKHILNKANNLPNAIQPPKTVLLTGANGFLGQTLCLKWLEKLEMHEGKLICIIRAVDDDAAKKRLDEQFTHVGSNLAKQYLNISKKYLEVLAGDISEPLLGLKAATFRRLADETDLICHAGALVNHRLGYRHLFGPNVRGTSEVINLALTNKKKTIDFISTIGVNELVQQGNNINLKFPLKSRLKLSNKYASGYLASKWASEHLLYSAHKNTGININISRCDMIMPNQHCIQQFNANDMLTRLLFSIMTTKLAPKSFYELNPDGTSQQSHYQGIPVNILADIFTASHYYNKHGFSIYNAYNYLEDNISLDTFVDFIQKSGQTIEKIDSYSQWYKQIKSQLDQLPFEQRKHSIIDMQDAFSKPFPAKTHLPDSNNFKQLARQTNNGADIHPLSESYIQDYLQAIRITLIKNNIDR